MFGVLTELRRYAAGVPPAAVGGMRSIPAIFANGLEMCVGKLHGRTPHSLQPTEYAREVCTHNSKPFANGTGPGIDRHAHVVIQNHISHANVHLTLTQQAYAGSGTAATPAR